VNIGGWSAKEGKVEGADLLALWPGRWLVLLSAKMGRKRRGSKGITLSYATPLIFLD